MLDNAVEKILVSEEEIADTVAELAEKITADYAMLPGKLVLVSVLKGSVVFTADLMKKINTPLEIEFIKASSYGAGTESSGKIKMTLDFERDDISECNLLIIEDIIDSGRTLTHLVEHFKKKGARSVHTCTLLDKPQRRVVDFTPDYVGKVIPDEFVIGYGLDYAESYRDLPFVGVLKPEVYSN